MFTAGIFGYGMVQQLVLGQPFGRNPTFDQTLVISGVLVFALDVGLIALFVSAHLRTEVRPDGLYIRYLPFHRSYRRIPLKDQSASKQ